MAWTTPLTAVSTATITAAQWNASVRDNLLETEAAKALTVGAHIVATGANALALRSTVAARVENLESTTSTGYADLGTPGPSVTATTGTSAIVWISGETQTNVNNSLCKFSFEVSGATTIAASDDWAVTLDGVYDSSPGRRGCAHRFSTLNAGSNTFKMKYAAGSNTASFGRREIIVMPF